MTHNQSDVIILGGGLSGGTLALALHQTGLRVTVVDQQDIDAQLAPSYDGRAFAIAYACFRQWVHLGLGEALAAQACRIEDILVSDGPAAGVGGGIPGPWTLRFLATELQTGTDEPLGYMLEARHIRQVLNAAMIARRITRHAPATPVQLDVQPAGAAVSLSDGTVLAAPLVVAADGRGSWARHAAGIETIGWDYNQDALVLTVRTARDHGGVAHECFLPSGPFAILPLSDQRANIVWTEKRDVAEALMAASDDLRWAAFMRRFGDHLGDVQPVSDIWRYPLSMQLATAMTAPRLALVGDAAHGIHPLAGQGLNLGLKDVAALCDVIATARHGGEDIGSAVTLARYSQWRRFDATTMALAMDGFYRLFANANPVLRSLRGAGLGVVDAVPLARRLFARMAGADVGAVPPAMRIS